MNNQDLHSIKYHKVSILAMVLILWTPMIASQHDMSQTSYASTPNAERIRHYVFCPTDTIRMMLDSADSVRTLFKDGILDNLNFVNELYNEDINRHYKHLIPSMVQLYATYDVITCFPTDEANAAFVWREMAQCQIADFYKKEDVTDDEINAYFNDIDKILSVYEAGSQHDMNNAAYRRVLMADFRLITAYKNLYTTCNEPLLLPFIHNSYCYIFQLFQTYCDQIAGSWSDLPRQLACVEYALITKMQHIVEQLLEEYERGNITTADILSTLAERPKSIDDIAPLE